MKLRIEFPEYPSIVRSAEAQRLGITHHALKYDRRFHKIYQGIRANFRDMTRFPTPAWADDDWKILNVRLRAGLMLVPDAMGCGITAARLYGLPIPSRLMSVRLHLVTADPEKRMFRSEIVLHRQQSVRAHTWLDLRLIAPNQLFLQLAPNLTLSELVILGDAIVGNWHGPPLCSLNDLRHIASTTTQLHGRARVAGALDLIRENVDSPQETSLRLWFPSQGLPEPTVHPQVPSAILGRIIEPDLGYRDVKLAFEYDGDHHRGSKVQWARDIERDDALRAEGWVVLRVTSRTDRRVLEAKIRDHLARNRLPNSH